MDATIRNLSCWPAQAQVTVSEAASILGRSTTWVRNRITDGSLLAVPNPDGGPLHITVQSIADLAESTTDSSAVNRKVWRRPLLRLVVDNTQK